MNIKWLSLLLLCLTGYAAGPNTNAVPIVLVWNNPGPQYSNLVYRLYTSTNAALPLNQWTPQIVTPVPVFTNQWAYTNSLVYGTYFFAVTWSNAMWRTESPFSNVVSPDQIPPITQQFNLQLIPGQ